MSSGFTAIELPQIPFPGVIDTLDFEVILAEMLADLRSRDSEFTSLVESDPAYKVLEVAAFREVLIRQKGNDQAKAVMLAYAVGTDLDNLVANFNVQRLVVDAGDPDAVPPVPPTFETDDELRRRALLAWEGLSTAGSVGSYIFHSLTADPDVKDASAISPTPGAVLVSVLSRSGNGSAPADVVESVDAALSEETVRPLTDNVTVQAASVNEYAIEAELTLYPGPDGQVVRDAAESAAQKYADDNHRLGRDITRSGIFSALHQPGVQNVVITSPASDITNDRTQASFCTSVNAPVVGRNE